MLPRIVVVGGGTGTYTALVGLKRHPVSLTAVVSMVDDGGSSGRLRDEFGHLPPGDVRRCLLALSAEESVSILRQVFDYRFHGGNSLSGHSVGNLILTALTELTGRTDQAVDLAAQLLHVKGTVLPATLCDSRLCAELEDGTCVRGESKIDVRTEKPDCRIRRVFLDPPAVANPRAVAAIEEAEAVVIGPGDLYTSVLPNLLVEGLAEAIARSGAVRIYVCNIMTKHGETDGFRASDFVREVQRYLGGPHLLDFVLVNDDCTFPAELVERYAQERAFPVEPDLERCARLGPRVHHAPLAAAGTLLRHDPARLACAILDVLRASQRAAGRTAGSPRPSGKQAYARRP